jgi:hypothetical protein
MSEKKQSKVTQNNSKQTQTQPKTYTQSSYRVITKTDTILYNPKVVVTRKRIISA